MGSAASTAGASLTETEIKSQIGVLYDDDAEEAFTKAQVGGRVDWPTLKDYGENHGLLDSKAVLFQNLAQFKRARAGLQETTKTSSTFGGWSRE